MCLRMALLMYVAAFMMLALTVIHTDAAATYYRTDNRGNSIERQRQEDAPQTKLCPSYHRILNGRVACNYDGCVFECNPRYRMDAQRPEDSHVTLHCDHTTGTHTHQGAPWNPPGSICKPVQPEEEKPNNRNPGSNQHRIDCESGTLMPNGRASVTLTYRDNKWWFPDGSIMLGVDQVTCSQGNNTTYYGHVKSPTQYVTKAPEDLTLSTHQCSPPCMNGGSCVYTDTCACTGASWGPRCQITTCPLPRFGNDIHASLGGNLHKMKFTCSNGRRTSRGYSQVVILCMQGQWHLTKGNLLTKEDVTCRHQRNI